MAHTFGAERGLNRFEGFTDAVFAIALTLLIVEIRPPGSPDGPAAGTSLYQTVMSQWRELLAFFVCFLSIGIYWLQHHYTGRLYTKTDHIFGLINLGFLLAVTTLPYPLRVWSFYVGTEHEAQASVLMTAGLLLPGVMWLAKWFYALPERRLVDPRLDRGFLRSLTWRYVIGVAVQALAVPVAIFAPRLGVAMTLAVNFFYILPPPKPRYRPGQDPDEERRRSEAVLLESVR